jgi:AraC-like DNA-binding protein
VGYYAEQQFLTNRYFSAIVKEKSGRSPSQWIATALLVDAQNLLRTTNLTIKEISDLLNFPNQSYFGKWFKHLTTIGPMDYRRGKMGHPNEDADFTDVVQRGLNHVNPENEKNQS